MKSEISINEPIFPYMPRAPPGKVPKINNNIDLNS